MTHKEPGGELWTDPNRFRILLDWRFCVQGDELSRSIKAINFSRDYSTKNLC
jgi:hypothetical protein